MNKTQTSWKQISLVSKSDLDLWGNNPKCNPNRALFIFLLYTRYFVSIWWKH